MMGGKPLGLGFSLFGYRRSAVIRLIEERGHLLSETQGRMQAAEERVAELESEMASLQAQNSRLEQHIELLRGQMVAIASRTQPLSHYLSSTPSMPEPAEPTYLELPVKAETSTPPMPRSSASRGMVEELARVLSAAEEGATRIIERAALTAQEHIDRSTRAWRELQAEAAKVDGWRRAMAPAITTVRSRLADVKARIEEIPTRIQEALAPMADAMSSIQESLTELSSLSRSLALPEWPTSNPGEGGEHDKAVDHGSSPNGQVGSKVIRVPEVVLTPEEEAAGWMRATVGY